MCKVRGEYQPYSHQVRGAGVLKQGQQQGVVVGERRLLAGRVNICQQLHTLGGRNQHCQIEQQSRVGETNIVRLSNSRHCIITLCNVCLLVLSAFERLWR